MLRLVSAGGSVEEFQWSTNEQVYPFERGPSGETLYAKQVNLSSIGAATIRGTAHGISNLDASSIRFFGAQGEYPLNYAHRDSLLGALGSHVTETEIRQLTGSNISAGSGHIRIIYSKTA